MFQRSLLTIGWLFVLLCISAIWTAVEPEILSNIGAIKTQNPKSIAAFFALVIGICKLGLLVPFWLIWRNSPQPSKLPEPVSQVSFGADTASTTLGIIDSDPKSLDKRDLAWGVVAANWFLLGMITKFAAPLRGSSVGFTEFFGLLFGILVMAAIPVAIAYIFVSDKKLFRFRLWLTVCAWILIFFTVYGSVPR